jgi:hypothetical protein
MPQKRRTKSLRWELYSSAEGVIAWLGEEDEQTPIAFSFIEWLTGTLQAGDEKSNTPEFRFQPYQEGYSVEY